MGCGGHLKPGGACASGGGLDGPLVVGAFLQEELAVEAVAVVEAVVDVDDFLEADSSGT